jgi:hypothetical protein
MKILRKMIETISSKFFEPCIDWTCMEEMISEHEKVYMNMCRYYNDDKSLSTAISAQGLLKYRLLGASFLYSAFCRASCKASQKLLTDVERKAVTMAQKPFSPDSQHPYLLDTTLIVSTAAHIFPSVPRLIMEDFNTPFKNFELLYAMHYEALHESIKDRDYLDGKKSLIAGHITAPMAHVLQSLA